MTACEGKDLSRADDDVFAMAVVDANVRASLPTGQYPAPNGGLTTVHAIARVQGAGMRAFA